MNKSVLTAVSLCPVLIQPGTGSAARDKIKRIIFKITYHMEKIVVLVFSSDLYNLNWLNSQTAADRLELAKFERDFGYDNAAVLTPAEYQGLFNAGKIDPNFCYIFFENNA